MNRDGHFPIRSGETSETDGGRTMPRAGFSPYPSAAPHGRTTNPRDVQIRKPNDKLTSIG